MTQEATKLMTEALKRVTASGSFSPAEIGARVGLDKLQALSAARWLSNAGVLVLGFDSAAHFSSEFRKSQAAPTRKKARKA
jgi:hypothetical protein